MYYRLLLLLFGDTSYSPGTFHNHLQLGHDEWNIFKHRGLHYLHFNINSLLQRIDELRPTAKLTNGAVTGISEFNLDNFGLTFEIHINFYDLLCCETGMEAKLLAILKMILAII